MDSSKPERWWLSASQFAELAGVSSKTAKRWIKSGKFKGYQLNGKGEHRILVFNIVATCKAVPDMIYILERFNERYTFVAPKLREAQTPGNPEAAS